jgi:hypothetical protein
VLELRSFTDFRYPPHGVTISPKWTQKSIYIIFKLTQNESIFYVLELAPFLNPTCFDPNGLKFQKKKLIRSEQSCTKSFEKWAFNFFRFTSTCILIITNDLMLLVTRAILSTTLSPEFVIIIWWQNIIHRNGFYPVALLVF